MKRLSSPVTGGQERLKARQRTSSPGQQSFRESHTRKQGRPAVLGKNGTLAHGMRTSGFMLLRIGKAQILLTPPPHPQACRSGSSSPPLAEASPHKTCAPFGSPSTAPLATSTAKVKSQRNPAKTRRKGTIAQGGCRARPAGAAERVTCGRGGLGGAGGKGCRCEAG